MLDLHLNIIYYHEIFVTKVHTPQRKAEYNSFIFDNFTSAKSQEKLD